MGLACGIDCGIRATKGVLVDEDGRLVARSRVDTDWDPEKAGEAVLGALLGQGGVAPDELASVVATGVYAEEVGIAEKTVSTLRASCAGARSLVPGTTEVVDLGAEGIRVCRIEESGQIANYAVNDKCASGAGAFLDEVSRILDIPVTEFGELSERHTEQIDMDTQCVVFAESEVISLIHKRVSPENVVYAIHEGLANKISTYLFRVGVTDRVTMVGAPALNRGLAASLSRKIGRKIEVPRLCEHATALGAALLM